VILTNTIAKYNNKLRSHFPLGWDINCVRIKQNYIKRNKLKKKKRKTLMKWNVTVPLTLEVVFKLEKKNNVFGSNRKSFILHQILRISQWRDNDHKQTQHHIIVQQSPVFLCPSLSFSRVY